MPICQDKNRQCAFGDVALGHGRNLRLSRQQPLPWRLQIVFIRLLGTQPLGRSSRDRLNRAAAGEGSALPPYFRHASTIPG